jgi:mRNA interferase MazF
MIQGDVYWFKFKEPNKIRPVLILTRTDIIPYRNSLTVAEITTTLRDNESEVWLNATDGMLEECAVNLSNIQTVSKEKFGSYITHFNS